MGVMRRRVAAAAVLLAVVVPMGGGPPAVGAPQRWFPWVEAVYHDLLDRAPTQAQLAHRAGQLEAGVPKQAIADQLAASRERALLIVDELFERVLERPADPAARAYWADRLTSGTAESTFASFVYGSPELYDRAGGTAEGYVVLLYRDVLGREPDAAGADYWIARLAAGENRTGLARSWYLSAEATGLRIGLHFLHLFSRPPTPAERADWGARLQRNDRRRIEAALVSSAGYGSWHDRPIVLTAGDGPSREPSISADGRIVVFTSAAGDLTGGGSPPGDDVFVFDRRTGRLRAITAGNGHSGAPEVSADGSTVVFHSAATNLVPDDGNGEVDVFRAPTAGGPIERLSDGEVASAEPTVSGDGSVVAFTAAGEVHVHTGAPGEVAVVERFDGFAPALAAGGRAITYRAGDHAYWAVLPLGAGPGPVQLDEVAATSTVTVSADGGRAVYVELTPSRRAVVLATLDQSGVAERAETAAVQSKVARPRLSDDGTVMLVDAVTPFTGHLDLGVALPGGAPRAATFPLRADQTGDGGLVVAAYDRQIVLYDGRRGSGLYL